jgi:hypothetical protein
MDSKPSTAGLPLRGVKYPSDDPKLQLPRYTTSTAVSEGTFPSVISDLPRGNAGHIRLTTWDTAILESCLLGFYFTVPSFIVQLDTAILALRAQLHNRHPFLIGAIEVAGAIGAQMLRMLCVLGMMQVVMIWWSIPRRMRTVDVEMMAGADPE